MSNGIFGKLFDLDNNENIDMAESLIELAIIEELLKEDEEELEGD